MDVLQWALAQKAVFEADPPFLLESAAHLYVLRQEVGGGRHRPLDG